MGGIRDKLPLPLQIFRKGADSPLGKEHDQHKDYDRAGDRHKIHNPKQIICRLHLKETVQYNDGAAAVRFLKNIESVIIHIAAFLPG